jgi:hypothetical protein
MSEPHNFANWEICSCDAARNEYYVSKGNDIPIERGLQREIRHCDRRQDIAPSVTSVTAELPVPMCPPVSDKWGATAGAVRPACDGPVMDDTMQLRGIELRYVVTMHLLNHGPASISERAEAVAWRGFAIAGRASKSISDALRWEMGYGRVRRLGRGLYGPGRLPRGTEHRIHKRVFALRHQASLSLRGGHIDASQTS